METTMSPVKQQNQKSILESFTTFDLKAFSIVMPIIAAAGLWYHSQYFVTKEAYDKDRREDRELAREVRDDLRDIKNHFLNRK